MATTSRKVGDSVLTSSDNTSKFLKNHYRAINRVAVAGATAVKKEARQIYRDEEGWAINSGYTMDWKGHGKVMLGVTGTLSLQIRTEDVGIPGLRLVGWFDDVHPDTDGRLTMGQLASIHEYGNPDNKLFGNPAPIPARPWLSRVSDDPAHSSEVTLAMMNAYLAMMNGYDFQEESI